MAARPAEDLRAAQSQAERDIQRADALRRERLAQETLQRGNGLAAIGPRAETVKPRERERERRLAKERPTSRQQLRREADGTWRAVAPSSRRTKG